MNSLNISDTQPAELMDMVIVSAKFSGGTELSRESAIFLPSSLLILSETAKNNLVKFLYISSQAWHICILIVISFLKNIIEQP
jgi:hypothetical protein